jgi:hypothetical protein
MQHWGARAWARLHLHESAPAIVLPPIKPSSAASAVPLGLDRILETGACTKNGIAAQPYNLGMRTGAIASDVLNRSLTLL